MQDGRVSAADGPRPVSHAATPQWQSFELRMRERRADRCARRARLALDAGQLQDAADALDEARRLHPLSPGVEELTRAIAVAQAADLQPKRRSGYRLVVVWSVVLAAGLLGQTADWSPSSEPQDVDETPAPARVESLVRLPAVPPVFPKSLAEGQRVEDSEELPPPATRVSVSPTDVKTADAIRRPVLTTPPKPAPPAPALINADAAVRARIPAAPVPAVRPMTAPEPIAAPLTAPATETRELPGTAAAAPAPIPDPRAAIRATLGRYESAYTLLDASAVQAVWPSLDHRALARAFEGLASQRVSLGSCDVNVTGETAKANCSGTAAWTPKVGGGSRSTSRRWVFDLTQADGAWRIVRVDAR